MPLDRTVHCDTKIKYRKFTVGLHFIVVDNVDASIIHYFFKRCRHLVEYIFLFFVLNNEVYVEK